MARLLASVAVEIGRGLLDQRHALAEHRLEGFRAGKPLAEGDRRASETALVLSHGFAPPLKRMGTVRCAHLALSGQCRNGTDPTWNAQIPSHSSRPTATGPTQGKKKEPLGSG